MWSLQHLTQSGSRWDGALSARPGEKDQQQRIRAGVWKSLWSVSHSIRIMPSKESTHTEARAPQSIPEQQWQQGQKRALQGSDFEEGVSCTAPEPPE